MKNLNQNTNQKNELGLKKKVIANLQTTDKTKYLLTTLSSSTI